MKQPRFVFIDKRKGCSFLSIKISVIYAIHTAGDSLKSSLESLLKQSFKDFEVIMVDAASKDATAEIMNSFCSDSRFKYIRLEDRSISQARNMAIKKAQGDYITFGDNDVVFTENFLEGLYECAVKEKAELCVAPMASSDIYGKHVFSSSGILSKRKRTNRFDTQLIWNPAITNKLFLKSKLLEMNHEFICFGKAREAAFAVTYALNCDVIASASKGAASYIIPVKSHGVSDFDVNYYRNAYKHIISAADKAFQKAIDESETEFQKKEYKRLHIDYIDQVYHKEITVLLYSYYRHFWSLNDEKIKEYADVVMSLTEKLSKSGFAALRQKNKDIFYSKKLIDNRAEMAQKPKVTVCIGKNSKAEHHEKNLEVQLKSIYEQTMPCFEVLVDSRLKDIFPEKYLDMENLKFINKTTVAIALLLLTLVGCTPIESSETRIEIQFVQQIVDEVFTLKDLCEQDYDSIYIIPPYFDIEKKEYTNLKMSNNLRYLCNINTGNETISTILFICNGKVESFSVIKRAEADFATHETEKQHFFPFEQKFILDKDRYVHIYEE